jgi:hypothetical protein
MKHLPPVGGLRAVWGFPEITIARGDSKSLRFF